jgi:hypothetical protein
MSQVCQKSENPAQDMANILFQTPPIVPTTDPACTRLLGENTRRPDSILYITYTWLPDEKFAGWQSHSGEAVPANTGTIVVGDNKQSTAASSGTISSQPASPVIKSVEDPTDLTALSTELSTFFETWNTPDRQFSICFDSITPLLTYVSIDRAYRFLSVLTSRVEAVGATAHYHLNPAVHTAQTVDKLSPLFDNVVERTDTG